MLPSHRWKMLMFFKNMQNINIKMEPLRLLCWRVYPFLNVALPFTVVLLCGGGCVCACISVCVCVTADVGVCVCASAIVRLSENA